MARARAAGTATLAAALLAAPAGLAAQAVDTTARVGFTVTLHAGGTAYTRFQNVTLEADGAPEPEYPAELAASTAATLSADFTVWFRPWIGSRIDFIYSPSNFEVRLSEEDRVDVLGEEADYQGLEYSDVSMFSITAAGVLALPIPSTHVATYALGGAGATLLRADDRGAAGLDRAFDGGPTAFDVAGIAGIGMKIPLRGGAGGRVSLSFELVDRITRTPVRANGGEILLETDGIRVINRLHATNQEGDAKFVHAVGFTAGLSFATGGATPAEEVPQ